MKAKYKGLLDDIKATQAATTATEPDPPSPAPLEAPPKREAKAKAEPEAPRGKGRPKNGKKSNSEYTQTSITVRETTLAEVKVALLRLGRRPDGTKWDVSILAEELFSDWLAKRG